MILGVVQARLGSKRLPRKVLKTLCGKPMILHIINRLKSSEYIDKVAVATTNHPEDKELEDFAKENNFGFYRGSELNIADRLYQTAKKYNADVLVRIWGDCPLFDVSVMNKVIETFLREDADYGTNVIPPTYPRGLDLEVYKTSTLKKITSETDDPFYLEYPREYVTNKPEFKVINVANKVDLSNHHWTVDYPEDFLFVEKVYGKLYREDKPFNMEDILKLLKEDKEIRELEEKNMSLRRNIEYYAALEERRNKK